MSLTKTMTHVEELRHVAAMDQCSWDYAQKLMRSSADEIDRLRSDLLWIASMADEDNEWDGVDRFRMARQKAIDAVGPSAEPSVHASDCATNNAPALPTGLCDCGAEKSTPEPAEQLYTVYEADLHEMLPGEPWPELSDNWTVVRTAKKSEACLHRNGCHAPVYKLDLCKAHYIDCIRTDVHDAGCASYHTPAFTAVQTPCNCSLSKSEEKLHKNPADFPGGPMEYPEDFDPR